MITLMTAGILLVSVGLTYAWWTKVRVICLRQDIFDIRDELFDAALDLNGLGDPAYRQARERLNFAAKIADVFSLPLVTAVRSMNAPPQQEFCSSNRKLQEAINHAIASCSQRIVDYLYFETFCGMCGWMTSKVWKTNKPSPEQTGESVSQWVSSPSPEFFQHTRRFKNNQHDGLFGTGSAHPA